MTAELSRTIETRECARVRRQIDAADREIGALVYELYGLTDNEIKIVERASDD